jgi:serine/threonine protein kinase
MEEECPLPAEGACSPELRDFVAQCMRKDPWQRPSAEQLMQHPFVTQKGWACRPLVMCTLSLVAALPPYSVAGHCCFL